ncbi:protein rolling stone-like isoform X2 [Pomacea canaliculata]|nr:protein rolling stone-like isoform X2 [Pomacea canaliculata]
MRVSEQIYFIRHFVREMAGDEEEEEKRFTMIYSLKSEFKCRKFGASHKSREVFFSSQWLHPKIYLVWRIFWALYHLGWMTYDVWYDVTNNPHLGTWLIYLTNWTFLWLTACCLLDAIVVCYSNCTESSAEELPWFMQLLWLAYEVSVVCSLFVSIVYWSVMFGHRKNFGPLAELTLPSLVTHLFNSIYVLMDLCVRATPIRLLHAVYSILYLLTYLVFAVIYTETGGKNMNGDNFIYRPMDWSDASILAVFVLAMAALAVLHLMVYTIAVVRGVVTEKVCRCKKNSSDVVVRESLYTASQIVI